MTHPSGVTHASPTPDAASGQAPGSDPETARIWRDPEPLRSDWPPPVRIRLWRWVLSVLALLVALVVVLALTGGFAERTDGRIDIAPGELFETGPYQLSFDTAVAWPSTGADDEVTSWNVRVSGFGRTTASASMNPPGGALLVGDRRGEIVEDGSSYRIGGYSDFGVAFQPGMPMQPYVVAARLPAEYQPDTELQIGVGTVRQENRSAAGDDSGLVWTADEPVYVIRVPLTILDADPEA